MIISFLLLYFFKFLNLYSINYKLDPFSMQIFQKVIHKIHLLINNQTFIFIILIKIFLKILLKIYFNIIIVSKINLIKLLKQIKILL